MHSNILISVISILLAVIGFFLKRIMDTTDRIAADVADMKPRVKILWEEKFSSIRGLPKLGSTPNHASNRT
jgi:hypothetical protein